MALAPGWPGRSAQSAQHLSLGRYLVRILPQERILAQKALGFWGLDFSSVTWITPLCSRASSQPTGVHRQWEDAPQAMPSRCGNLKYAVKEGPGFVLILLPYCVLLYKRLQFKINRSDSQLMWYSGRPEFLLLWQWSSAHLFCR